MPHSRDAHPFAAALLRPLAAAAAGLRAAAGRRPAFSFGGRAERGGEEAGALTERVARACGADGVVLVDRAWRVVGRGAGPAWGVARVAPGVLLWDALPELRGAMARLRACMDGRATAAVFDDGAVLVHAVPVGGGLALCRRPSGCGGAAARELAEAQRRVERARRAQVRFLESINHDLRQPAQSIGLLAAVLEARRPEGAAGRAVDALGEAAVALGSIVDGLGGVSAAAEPGPLRPVPLGPLLGRLAAEYAPRMAEAGLTLRAVPTRAVALSEPAGLERVLRALLDNAARFTPQGGVLLGCRREGARLRVEVVDTGVGIAAADLDCIFEPLHQVGNPERDRRRGLGLGLTVARAQCESLGHALRVRSIPGRGSSFAVVLGRPGGGEAAPEPRVLLVGSAPLFAVDGWGIPVRLAASAAQAAAMIAAGARPAVVVAPTRLPDGTAGAAAVAAVRRALGAPIPAALLTGGGPEDAADAAAHGCVAVAPQAAGAWLTALLARGG